MESLRDLPDPEQLADAGLGGPSDPSHGEDEGLAGQKGDLTA